MKSPKFKSLLWAFRIALVGVVGIVPLGINARLECDAELSEVHEPPPHFSTRLALYPHKQIVGVSTNRDFGWVVSYVAPSKGYGKAFHLSFFGRIKGRGTPRVVADSIRDKQREGDLVLEEFRVQFARVDAATEVGRSYSAALPYLGPPTSSETNDQGVLEVYFSYVPDIPLGYGVDWLTNGFSLHVVDDIITSKAYSYTSTR